MRQRIIITLAVAAVALVATTAALASTLTATANVSGTAGISLNLPSNPSITDTLDGTDQTVSYAPALGVVDARGTGAGWNLQISATTFSDGAGHTLAPGQVASVASACTAGSTCTAATSSGITYPLTIAGAASKFFNAALNTGLGKINVTPTINVAIPGNAYAGTYTSTVTLAATTGP
jgi:putative surface cell wall-binding protein